MNTNGSARRPSDQRQILLPDPQHNNPLSSSTHQQSSVEFDRDSATSDEEGTSHGTSSTLRPLSLRFKLVLLTIFVIIFFVCITFAVRNWSKYERERVNSAWSRRSCKIHEVTIEEDPHSDEKYRVEARVTRTSGATDDGDKLTAFYGKSSAFWMTWDKAIEFKGNVRKGNTQCWFKDSDPTRVSVRDESEDDAQISPLPLYLAWTTTFLASIMGIIIVTLASQWLHDSIVSTNLLRRSDVDGVTTPGAVAKRRAFLSGEQVRQVCTSCAQDVKSQDAAVKDWTCSVCLDGVDDGGNIVLRTVLLPCQHRFHRECIKRWLRRGRAACPLCDWDVHLLFEENEHAATQKPSPARAEVTNTSGDTEPQQTELVESTRRSYNSERS